MIWYTAKVIVVGASLFLVSAIPTAMSQPVTRQDFVELRNGINENFYRQNERIRRVEREMEDIRDMEGALRRQGELYTYTVITNITGVLQPWWW